MQHSISCAHSRKARSAPARIYTANIAIFFVVRSRGTGRGVIVAAEGVEAVDVAHG